MNSSRGDLIFALLPLAAIGVGVVVCGIAAWMQRQKAEGTTKIIAIATLSLTILLSLLELYRKRGIDPGIFVMAGAPHSNLASGTIIVDKLSIFATVVFSVFALATVLTVPEMVRNYHGRVGAIHALLLSATGGAILLASQREAVTLLLATAIVTISVTALAAFHKTNGAGLESALKYLVASSVATALLAMGLAFLYGISASSDPQVAATFAGVTPLLTALGAVMVIVALGMLLGIVPLPQWLPSLGATLPATLVGFVVAVGGGGFLLALARLTTSGFGGAVPWWPGVIAALGLATLFYGGFNAFRQNSVRQTVLYSAIAQSGFTILALVAFGAGTDSLPADGVEAFILAMVSNALSITAIFCAISQFESQGVEDSMEGYSGLAYRNGPLSLFLGIGLLSLAGLPPTAGFVARLLTLQSAAYVNYAWVLPLALLGAIVAAIAPLRLAAALLQRSANSDHAIQIHGQRLRATTVAVVGILAALLTLLVEPILKVGESIAGVLSR